MRTFGSAFGIRNSYSLKITLLTITWILGLLTGAFYLNGSPTYYAILSAPLGNLSGVGLIICFVFPILLSFILLRFFCFYCILPFVFFKAFSFMFCFGSISLAYGNAGWLVSRLIFFSDCVLILLLLFQWYTAAIGGRCNRVQCCITYFLVPTIVGILDYFVISPFWSTLVNH